MSENSQPTWLAEAWSLHGLIEAPGVRDNPRILELYRDAGHPEVRRDSVAWCAAFVGACLRRAGMAPSGSLLARSYLDWGEALDAPRVGALAVFPRGSDPALGHVGFIVGMTSERLAILGGNQDDSVRVDLFDRDALIGIRWPNSVSDQPSRPIFERALAHVLKMEGGYTDDPHDPGGPTNRGITLGVFAKWRGIDVRPETFADLKADLRRINSDTVLAIYRRRYWEPSSAEHMPDALALMHFDASVNHGLTGAARILQQALGVEVDGEIGPITLGAATTTPLPDLVERYADLRIARYRALPHFWRFGRGWLNRVAKTRTAAQTLLSTSASQKDSKTMTTLPSGTAPKWWGASMTIWGTIITGLSTVLPAIGPLFGIDVTGEMIVALGHSVTAVFQALGGVVGTILAIYGRMRAVQPLMRRDVALRL